MGINFAPEPTGIAPYTTDIAHHLVERGAEVTVLCGPPSYPAWRVDRADRAWRRETTMRGADVVRLWHYVPKHHSGLTRATYELTFGAHVALGRLRKPPDVVYAVVPSLAGSLAALWIANRNSVPLVVHVQDMMGKAAAQSGLVGGGRLAGVTSRLESFLLRHADSVAVISESFLPVLKEYAVASDRVCILRNWTHISEPTRPRETMRRSLDWNEHVTIALHTGNMGWKQDLGNVIDAARLTVSDPQLLWVLMGDGSQRSELKAQAAGLPNLRFLPPCDALSYPDVLAAADVLLLNERASIGEMSLPGKLTSYFATGLPVVAAVASGSASAAEVRGLGNVALIAPGDPQSLAAKCKDLSWARESPQREMPIRSKVTAMVTIDEILGQLLR